MKAERLLAAFGQLEEQYIEEAAPGAQGKRRASRVKRNAAAAAAMLLIFAGVFGTAMAVNAGFRQMVLSFFHIGQVESVPDHNGDGFGVSESDIGGIVKAECSGITRRWRRGLFCPLPGSAGWGDDCAGNAEKYVFVKLAGENVSERPLLVRQ